MLFNFILISFKLFYLSIYLTAIHWLYHCLSLFVYFIYRPKCNDTQAIVSSKHHFIPFDFTWNIIVYCLNKCSMNITHIHNQCNSVSVVRSLRCVTFEIMPLTLFVKTLAIDMFFVFFSLWSNHPFFSSSSYSFQR